MLKSMAEFIPTPNRFRIADDKIAVLFDADDARVHEIPSSLPVVIADQQDTAYLAVVLKSRARIMACIPKCPI